MRKLRELLFRLRALFRREQLDAEMREEIEYHLDRAVEERVGDGVSVVEARHAAQRAFGGMEQIKERVREQRGLLWLEQLGQDLCYALRTFGRNPGFTSVVLVSLALGIGANTAIFSLLDAVLWKTLPVAHPEELVFLERYSSPTPPAQRKFCEISYPLLEALESNEPLLAGATTARYSAQVMRGANDAALEPVTTLIVDDDFYSVLGVSTAVGRPIQSGDVRSSERIAVVSHGFWQRRFGGAPIVGTPIALNGVPHTIVGVTPREFFGIEPGTTFDVSVPFDPAELRTSGVTPTDPQAQPLLWAIARLKHGVTTEQAAHSLTRLVRRLARADGHREFTAERIAQLRIEARPASQGLNGLRRRFSNPLFALAALVGLVLLITCANVANLLLARASARGWEMAIRASIGAGRARLCRQLVTESLVLALAGGTLGLLVAHGAASALLRLAASGNSPIVLTATIDHRALAFTAGISLLTGLVFGLAPAWSSARTGAAALHPRARPAGGALSLPSRLLVVAQVALCVVLLAGAGLFVRTLQNLQHFDSGFRREQVLVVSVEPRLAGLRGAAVADLYVQVLERLEALPGVVGATFERNKPLSGSFTTHTIAPPGYEPPAGGSIATRGEEVGPRFFETLGMRLTAGRDFRPSDDRHAPPVIAINEAAAREFFPGQNPIGLRLGPLDDRTRAEVIAVVADVRHVSVREPAQPMVYLPVLQSAAPRDTAFFIRTTGEATALAPRVRQIIGQTNPNVPIMNVTTLEDVATRSLIQERLLATLASVFGGVALALAAVGLGGVLLFSVTRRTQEIGIRMALGATRRNVITMIVRQSLALVGIGFVVGMPCAIVAGRAAQSMLFGLAPEDPASLVAAAGVLALAAVVAALWPASRAAKIDPMVALRTE